jgi:hypothetical protein
LHSLYSELLPLLEAPNALGFDLAAVADRRLHDRTTSDQAKRLRILGKALEAESKSAEKAGNIEPAVAFALADVRLGTVFCRSGVMIDAMIGHAVMGRGSAQLAAIRQQLDPALGRKVSEALQAIEALHEPAAAICRRDMAYCEDLYGWQVRLSNIVERITNGPQMQWEGSQAFSGMVDRWLATSRLLQTDLAIRRFRAEQGELPADLEDMVPKYLPVVPLDRFTQRPLVYRAAGDEFTLYSVGDDGADNGGKFTDRKTYLDARFRSGYDFDLDTFTRP